MRYTPLLVLLFMMVACQEQPPVVGGAVSQQEHGAAVPDTSAAAPVGTPAEERAAGSGGTAHVDLQALARPAGEESVCRTFARKVAEAALRYGDNPDTFVAALQDEFVGGADNPFDMRRGLREGTWNQRYFYAGHGGFLPDYDDAQRYPRGGNHQPGHFVSVLSIAAQFGDEQARIAIAEAGDYDEGQEDDLRLSMVAIPLGVGLRDGSVTTADVAQRVRGLCR